MWQTDKQTNIIGRYTSFPLCVNSGSKWFMIITHIWFIWEKKLNNKMLQGYTSHQLFFSAKFSKVAWMFFKVAKKYVFLVF